MMTEHNNAGQKGRGGGNQKPPAQDRAAQDRTDQDSGRGEVSQDRNRQGRVSGDESPARTDGGRGPAGEQNEVPTPESLAQESDQRFAELEDRWLRTVADLDNLRKRTVRDIERQRADERARVAAEWLPVIDNLELALEHAGGDCDALVEGVRAVRDQAVGVLARLGFPRQDDVGAKFDPSRHDAVSAVPDTNTEPGTVVHVLRPGYGDGERQLRPAAVVVATKAE